MGIPLAIALALAATFVVLLFRQGRNSRKVQRQLTATEKNYSLTPIPLEEYPRGSPTDPDPRPLKRYGGEFPRWNLRDLPKGWDPVLAKQIHTYFEKMSVDFQNAEQLATLRSLREEFREFLAELGPEALPTLGTILNAEGDFVDRRFLLNAIGDLGPRSDKATYILRDFYMARHADRHNDSEMWHVIKAMERLQNDSSFDMLSDMAQRPDPTIERDRDRFIEALGEHHRRADAVGVFVDHLDVSREVSKPVRNKAAQALGKVRDPETLNDLYRAAENETYWATKQTMFGSIGKIGDPSSVGFLERQYRESLKTPETRDENLKAIPGRVRLGAARAISRIATPHAIEVLHDLLQVEPDQKIRSYVEKWVAESEKKLQGQ